MLMGDEGYVKPASRESRLVMVKLEPSAEDFKWKKSTQETKEKGKEQEKTRQETTHTPALQELFRALGKHVAIGKGFMAAHAHDIRLKVRPKRSNISRREQAKILTFEPVGSKIM